MSKTTKLHPTDVCGHYELARKRRKIRRIGYASAMAVSAIIVVSGFNYILDQIPDSPPVVSNYYIPPGNTITTKVEPHWKPITPVKPTGIERIINNIESCIKYVANGLSEPNEKDRIYPYK